MDRDISFYNQETHTLYIREGADAEELAAVFDEMPIAKVMKLREALLMVVAIISLEQALVDRGDRLL